MLFTTSKQDQIAEDKARSKKKKDEDIQEKKIEEHKIDLEHKEQIDSRVHKKDVQAKNIDEDLKNRKNQ